MIKKAFIILSFTGLVIGSIFVFSHCGGDVSSILPDTGENQRTCKNSAQCGMGEKCINGLCVKVDGGGIQSCRNNSDCSADEECVNSVCQKKAVDAGEEIATDVTPVETVYCNYNSECPAGFVCNVETHSCVPGGRIKVEPDKLAFGAAAYGQEVKQTVVVTNVGNGPLTIYVVDFESNTNPDPDHPRFRRVTDRNIPATLSPNDVLNIDVYYRQDDAEPDNGFLVISSSDITQPQIKVFMYSQFKNPPDLKLIDRSFDPPRVLYPQPESQNTYTIDLGNIPVGGTRDLMISLLNDSDGSILAVKSANIVQMSKNKIDVVFQSIFDPNTKYTAPMYISSREMIDMYIHYAPSQKEAQELTRVTLITNDRDINNDLIEDSGELVINIVGQGGYVPPGINVSKNEINFGEVQVGLYSEDIFNICNNGEDNLVIDGTSGLDNPNTDFSISPSKLGGTILGGACIEVKVKFTPLSQGSQFNKIIIKSNDSNNPSLEVKLYGIGTDPNLVLNPDKDIDFGIVEVGKESPEVSLSIFNSGKGNLSIDSIGLSIGSSTDFILTNLPQQFPVILKGDGQGTLIFGVKFKPSISSDPKPIKGAIEIKSSDKDNQIKYINLSGIGFACPIGFSDCNNDMSDRCETNVNTSIDHCGGCNNRCTVANGTPECVNGKCQIKSCNQFYADCDNLYVTGCETPTENDIYNCGGCGIKCTVLNGVPKCTGGVCGIEKCNSPYKDCKNGYLDGCETNTNTDPNNCGGCGKSCSAPNATTKCNNGFCAIDKCDNGFRDCDGVYSNGCETYIFGDPNNCGNCGAICILPNATSKCVSGQCAIDSCIPNYADCNGKTSDGCEVDLSRDVNNCGYCNYVCSLNNAQAKCVNKTCAIDYCLGSYRDCNGSALDGCETDTSSNVNNCGSCGNKCTVANGTAKCVSGACDIASCNTGYKDCKNGYSDGCETNITNDVNNCGNCGVICNVPPYAQSVACQNSTCKITACSSTYYDIDGIYSNGCECRQDNDDINGNGNTYGKAIDLGTLQDSAKQYVQVTGRNIVPAGDEDWYKVVAQDVATSGYNNFDFIVEIVGCDPYNPGACEFQIEVYKDVVDNNHKVCSNDVYYRFTVNFREDKDGNGKNEGENPCTASCISNDFINNCCHNYTATYYIKVYRRAGATASCNNYVLKITNGT